ncbi:unnamed protein product [Leptosia nina]|uniref:Uncharacterized protein n=1 Tax=Leptosia nina TaxID=320188 RepID=A0AAV1JWN2_9NEOP
MYTVYILLLERLASFGWEVDTDDWLWTMESGGAHVAPWPWLMRASYVADEFNAPPMIASQFLMKKIFMTNILI